MTSAGFERYSPGFTVFDFHPVPASTPGDVISAFQFQIVVPLSLVTSMSIHAC